MPNWTAILDEINRQPHAINFVRRKYLKKLNQKTGRNIISYYSGFLSKPGIFQSMILDEDKNGFMMAIHGLDRSKGLDLIIHTEGGDIAATESIVDYLQKLFDGNIRAIVPQIAMSAGTMLACSCKTILMGKQSNLGPIDPHIKGIPAHAVIEEFEKAYQEIKKDRDRVNVWMHILSKYQPTFLSQCQYAIDWAKEFVQTQLIKVMFSGEADATKKADYIINKLGYNTNKTSHSKHLPMEYCKSIGLKVESMEDDQTLQDLILTVHHCYMHTLTNSNIYKIVENHKGSIFAKQTTA